MGEEYFPGSAGVDTMAVKILKNKYIHGSLIASSVFMLFVVLFYIGVNVYKNVALIARPAGCSMHPCEDPMGVVACIVIGIYFVMSMSVKTNKYATVQLLLSLAAVVAMAYLLTFSIQFIIGKLKVNEITKKIMTVDIDPETRAELVNAKSSIETEVGPTSGVLA